MGQHVSALERRYKIRQRCLNGHSSSCDTGTTGNEFPFMNEPRNILQHILWGTELILQSFAKLMSDLT